jgi:hypothetical protein
MKNKIKKITFLLVVGMLLSSQMLKSQGLINNGSKVIIETGAYLVIQGNILNQSVSNNNGTFSLAGDLKLTGNFTNNATGGDVFSANTGTITFNGSTTQEVNGSAATNFGDMVLANSVEFNDISQQALNSINLSGGKLLVGDVDFEIASTATITGYSATNYIVADGVGKLVRTINDGETVFFPVGSATRYAPVTISQAAGADDGDFKVRVVDNVLVLASSGNQLEVTKKYVNKTWFIESTASTLNLNIELSWTAADHMNGFDPTQCYISHFSSSNSTWDFSNQWGAPASQNSGVYSITRSGVTSLSPFTVGDVSTGPLPVEILSFDGEAVGNDVVLNWVTSAEVNNRGFEVYSSVDAKNFKLIGFIDGAGNSNTMKNYDFTDVNAANSSVGVLYYQLRQIDFDGKSERTKIIAIHITNDRDYKLVVYPNPTTGLVKILNAGDCNQMDVYDLCGKKLLTSKIDADGYFDLTGLAKGVYQLVSYDEGVKKTARILVR